MNKVIVYVDMDDVLCDYSGAYQLNLNQNPEIKFPQSQYGFFRNLVPVSGALSAMRFLQSYQRVDVYILTAPSVKNPLCYTEKREWVEHYLGMEMVEKLIISPNKGLNKGAYLIDDRDFGRGQELFEGELIKFGSDLFPDWKSVITYLTDRLAD